MKPWFRIGSNWTSIFLGGGMCGGFNLMWKPRQILGNSSTIVMASEWFRNGPYTCSYMCTWFKYGDHEKMMLSSNWGELWYAGDELNIAVGNIIKPSIWYLAGSTEHLHGFTLKYESCNEKLLISGFRGGLYMQTNPHYTLRPIFQALVFKGHKGDFGPSGFRTFCEWRCFP